MFEWSDEQQMMRDAVRQFIEAEIAPRVDEFEHEGVPPYDTLRKMFQTFGMDVMARAGFEKRIAREKAIAAGEEVPEREDSDGGGSGMAVAANFVTCAIGEESGALDSMLGKVADFFEAEVDDAVDALSSLMEPIIMVFLGTLIGGMVIAMYLPIFKMGAAIGG